MQLGTLTKDWPVATRSSSQDPYDQVPPWLWFERIWALQTRTSWKAKESALKVKARNKNKGCEAFCVSLKLASASEKSMRDLLLDCLQFNQCETRRRIFRQFLSCKSCSYTENRGKKARRLLFALKINQWKLFSSSPLSNQWYCYAECQNIFVAVGEDSIPAVVPWNISCKPPRKQASIASRAMTTTFGRPECYDNIWTDRIV